MRKFAIALFTSALLTACGNSDGNSTTIIVDKPETPEFQNVVKSEEVGMRFQTKTGRFFRLETTLESYTIDVRLKSGAGTGSSEFSDTSPPMPALVGGISFLQAGGSYLVNIPGDENTKSLGKPFTWSRITIACAQGATKIYVNGEYHSESSACPMLTEDVRIGRGYSQRFWQGRIEYFDIYSGDQTALLFDADSAPQTGSKVLSLEKFDSAP